MGSSTWKFFEGAAQFRAMPTSYVPYAPTQDFLLPLQLQRWLLQDHHVRSISDAVDQLNLRAFYERFEDGRSRYQGDRTYLA